MKKIFVVLAILFTGILLAGCTSQPATPVATPTPTPVPTAVPTIIETTAVPVPTTEVVVVVVNTTVPTTAPTPTPTPQPSKTITFTSELTINPGTTVIIPVGGKVIWVNDDPRNSHGVQAIDVQGGKYFGGMNTTTIPFGKPLEVTFDKEGYYDYKTVFQPETTGTVIVTK